MEKRTVRSVSHKGEKVCSYTVDFKLEVVKYAEQSSIHAAGRKYNVSRSSVRDWKKKKLQLEDLRKANGSGAHRRRLSGGGRKVFDSCTERSLIEWITERKRQGLTISGALIIKKAKSLQQEKLLNQQQQLQQQHHHEQQKQEEQEEEKQEQEQQEQQQGQDQGEHQHHQEQQQKEHTHYTPVSQQKTSNNRLTYSRGWLEKFMNRNGLALKNFPTYRSPVTTTEVMKMEINEQLPTVIPLDDLLPDVSINSTTGDMRVVSLLTTDGMRDSGFTTGGMRVDGSLDNTPIDTRDSISLEKTMDDIHEFRSLNNTADKIRKSRQLDNPLLETPKRNMFDKVRDIHTPTVIPLDEAYARSSATHPFHKNEVDDTYAHTSASTMYYKTRVDDAYQYTTASTTIRLTRLCNTYPHTTPSNTFYKPRVGDTYAHVSDNITFQKTRGDNTYTYNSPNTTLHKSRIGDTYTYTSPNTTFLKTRIDDTYTYTSSNAFHKSRDMQNPIVIPLDDILPEYNANNKISNSRDIPSPESNEKILLTNREKIIKHEM